MTGRPVNIAEFRCRAIRARTAQFSLRNASRLTGLKVVQRPAAQCPVVFDIGMARDAQRFRRRANTWPISLERRAKVIRFGESHPMAAAMRASQPSPVSRNGPFDFPPAA
ncbi:MAG: hypothetical protein WCF17_08115 [Terracidiphilus sp.]